MKLRSPEGGKSLPVNVTVLLAAVVAPVLTASAILAENGAFAIAAPWSALSRSPRGEMVVLSIGFRSGVGKT